MPKVKGKIKKKSKGKVQATECNNQYTPSNHCRIRQATPLARMTTVPWESLHSCIREFYNPEVFIVKYGRIFCVRVGPCPHPCALSVKTETLRLNNSSCI